MMQLADSLRASSENGKILTIQPGGNHGDTMIYRGLFKILSEHGIDSVQFGPEPVRDDTPRRLQWYNSASVIAGIVDRLKYVRHRLNRDIAAVYIHGGGNFNDIWWNGVECFALVARLFDCPIIVGPQSVRFDSTDPEEIFSGISNEVIFYCREEFSYEIMNGVSSSTLSVDLSHDTALALDSVDLPINSKEDDYTLLAFRGDRESTTPFIETTIDPPTRVRDISVAEESFAGFCNAAAGASEIYTDRLHVAILGAMLDKPVSFFGNSYHKNRGVYDYSLSDNPNITFVGK